MSEELKPCPFCGANAELERESDHHGEWFNLGCSSHFGKTDAPCIAGRIIYTQDLPEMESAIAAWNRRAPIQFTSDNLRPVTDREADQ